MLFVASETLNLVVGLWAVRGAKHRHLMAWVPTLHVYFPLGAIASYKALWEAVRQPFYWDKTCHGVLDGPADAQDAGDGPLILTNPILPARPAVTRGPCLWQRPAPAFLRPPPAATGSPPASALALQRPGIEFQPCFEGF